MKRTVSFPAPVEFLKGNLLKTYGQDPKYTQGQCANLAFAIYLFLESEGVSCEICADRPGEHWWVQYPGSPYKFDADFWGRYDDASPAIKLSDDEVESFIEWPQGFVDKYNVRLSNRTVSTLKGELQGQYRKRMQETESDAIGYKLGKFLYHVTPEENADEIRKLGICPATGGNTHLRKTYSPRVYLATSLIAAYDLVTNFSAHRGTRHVIFKVDPSFVGEFKKDPDFMHGIYLEGYGIPPEGVLEEIDPDSLDYDENDLDELYEDAIFERIAETVGLLPSTRE